jgi:hypothetical protein
MLKVGQSNSITRFELAVEEDGKTVTLQVTPNATPGIYQRAEVLLFKLGLEGETSYSDREIGTQG